MLRTALEEAAHWPDQLRVAVNLSPIQFNDPATVDMIAQLLKQTGVRSARLELEITEQSLISDDQRAMDVLHRIKSLGVKISTAAR